MKTVSSKETSAGNATRRDRVLLSILGALVIVWLATWPIRTRLIREAARIERETAQQAQNQRALSQLSMAETDARRRVEMNPQDLQTRLDLAKVLSQLRNYPEAIETLNAAEAIDPRSALPHTALGDIYSAMNMPDLAMSELEAALKRDPNDQQALTLLAFKYVSFGWNSEARRLLTRALDRLPNDPQLHTALALANFQTGNSAESEKHLLIARRLAPDDPSTLGPLIEVYRHAQRYADAQRLISQALPTTLDKTFLFLEQAQIYLEQQNGQAALQAAEQALQHAPGDLHATYLHGQANKMLGRIDAAVSDLEKVRARDPYFEQTLLLLGQIYSQHGQRKQGTALILEYNGRRTILDDVSRFMLGVAEHPNDAKAHLKMGIYNRDTHNYPRAIVEFKRALELRPHDTEARTLLQQSLRQVNRGVEADAIASHARP